MKKPKKQLTHMNRKQLFVCIAAASMLAGCNNRETDTDASGVFEATEIIVSAKGSGEILALNIDEGMEVKAGLELGRIDTVQLVLKRRQLVASMSATDSKRLDEHRQLSSIRQEIDNLRRERSRFAALAKENAATQKQVDDIDYRIAVAERQLSASSEQISGTNTSISRQSEGIAAQVAQVEDQLRNTRIASPIDGTILAKYMERGEYAVPGKAVFKVADVSNMTLRAYITASQLTTLKLGQHVTVFADQGQTDRKAYEGTVVWIANKAEFTPKTIQTRDERANLVYAVKIAVKNDGMIKIGMYGDVKF